MDRVANLLNDPNKTDYKYPVILPYLNMAIEELSESLEESNSSPSQSLITIDVPVGVGQLSPAEDTTPGAVHYPDTLTEIQEISERPLGSLGSFIPLPRLETVKVFPATNSLLFWRWEQQYIKFNPNGATIPVQLAVTFMGQGVPYVASENTLITMINSRSYLAYKTAALCAMFIGENETRAGVLEVQAEKAMERLTTISNKGRQQIMTRHRPFRAGYKSRGGF
jgi:hypothetical protein